MNKFKVGDLVEFAHHNDGFVGLVEDFWFVGLHIVEYRVIWNDGDTSYETEGMIRRYDESR
jgi:hypothetical protein